MPRTRSQKCSNVKDRKTCLVTDHLGPDYIGPCGWCGKACGGADYENYNWCEPVALLKTWSISFYETCLKPGKGIKTLEVSFSSSSLILG